MTMKRILVEGQSCDVVETLGYQHGAGYVKIVRLSSGEQRTVVSRAARGPWRWWTTADMLQPGGLVTGQEVTP